MARSATERGQVLPMVGIVLAVLITFTSIALDLGYQRVERRDMQAVADVVALDLSRLLDGRTGNALRSVMGDAAATSATRNDHPMAAADVAVLFGDPAHACKGGSDIVSRCLVVEMGTVGPTNVFTPLDAPCNAATSANCVPDAVRVWAGTDVDYFFRPGSGDTRRSAVAAKDACGEFLLGSLLVTIDTGQARLLNRLLPRWLRSPIDDIAVSAVSWQGVANTAIDLGRVATEAGFATPDAMADAGVINARDFYLASARALDSQGRAAEADVLEQQAAVVDAATTFDFGGWIRGGTGNGSAAGADAAIPQTMPLLPYVTGSAQAIDGSNTVSLSGLDVGIPGLVITNLDLTVTQPPTRGDCRTAATSGQVVLNLTAALDVDQADISLLNSTLGLSLPVPALLGARLTGQVSMAVTVAGATGTLRSSSLVCPDAPGAGFTVDVDTQLIQTTAAATVELTATLLGLPVLSSRTTIATASPLTATGGDGALSFAHTTEFAPPVGPAGSKRLSSPSSLGLQAPFTATSSNTILLPLTTLTLNTSISNTNLLLQPMLGELNRLVVTRMSSALGLGLGSADVTALELGCNYADLVG